MGVRMPEELTNNTMETEAVQPDPAAIVSEIAVEAVTVSEFGGKVPTVPFAPGVSVESLTTNTSGARVDDDPFFLVMPISETGRVSKNGLLHDDALADSLVRQIMEDRPGGIMGHIPDAQRGSAYPVSQIHWVGATRHEGRVWAKGYIPVTMPEVREEYRLLKAKGGKAATSIYGRAVKELDAATPGHWRARNFKLEQIDLAPHTRASLPGSGVFALAAEMAGDSTNVAESANAEESDMSEAVNLAELSVKDIKALPAFADLRAELLTEFEAERGEQARVTELEAQVTQSTTRIAELEAEAQAKDLLIAEFQSKQFGADLDAKIAELTAWNVNTEAGKEKLASLRASLRALTVAKLGTVREMEQAEATLTELMTGDYKLVVETVRDALAGPGVIVPGKDRDKGDVVELDTSEEAGVQAMNAVGLAIN